MSRQHIWVLLLLVAAAGCSRSRTPSGPDGGRDGSLDDAGPGDAGLDFYDATPPDGGTTDCVPGVPTEVLRRPAAIGWPALASRDGRILLVFTEMTDPAMPSLHSVRLESGGTAMGPVDDVAEGSGGTLVPHRIADDLPGFTLSFRTPDAQLAGAVFGPEGRPEGVSPGGFGPTETQRPGLAFTPRLAVNAWNAVGALQVDGLINDVVDHTGGPLMLPGEQDPVLMPGADPDSFRIATHGGSSATLRTFDAGGRVRDEQTVTPEPGIGPVGLGGALLVEEALDAYVLWGGVIRALDEALIIARLGDQEATWSRENDFLWDAAAAYDPASGVLGVAAGMLRLDEATGERLPSVFLHVLSRGGTTAELDLSGPIADSDPGSQVQVAVVATGGTPTFLAVWTEQRGGEGILEAATVTCR